MYWYVVRLILLLQQCKVYTLFVCPAQRLAGSGWQCKLFSICLWTYMSFFYAFGLYQSVLFFVTVLTFKKVIQSYKLLYKRLRLEKSPLSLILYYFRNLLLAFTIYKKMDNICPSLTLLLPSKYIGLASYFLLQTTESCLQKGQEHCKQFLSVFCRRIFLKAHLKRRSIYSEAAALALHSRQRHPSEIISDACDVDRLLL